MIAELWVCDSNANFPIRVFNPEWEQRIASVPIPVTPSIDELETTEPSVAVYTEAVAPSPALRITELVPTEAPIGSASAESVADISAAARLVDTVPTVPPLDRGVAATASELLDNEAANYCATVPSAPEAMAVGEGIGADPTAHILTTSAVASPPRRNRRLKQRRGRHTSSWHRSRSSTVPTKAEVPGTS